MSRRSSFLAFFFLSFFLFSFSLSFRLAALAFIFGRTLSCRLPFLSCIWPLSISILYAWVGPLFPTHSVFFFAILQAWARERERILTLLLLSFRHACVCSCARASPRESLARLLLFRYFVAVAAYRFFGVGLWLSLIRSPPKRVVKVTQRERGNGARWLVRIVVIFFLAISSDFAFLLFALLASFRLVRFIKEICQSGETIATLTSGANKLVASLWRLALRLCLVRRRTCYGPLHSPHSTLLTHSLQRATAAKLPQRQILLLVSFRYFQWNSHERMPEILFHFIFLIFISYRKKKR